MLLSIELDESDCTLFSLDDFAPDANWNPESVADRFGPIAYKTGPLPPTHDLPADTRLQRHPTSIHRSQPAALTAARQHALEHGYDLKESTTLERGKGQEWVQLRCHRRGLTGPNCGYICWLKHEGRGRWRLEADTKEHNGHSAALSIGVQFWRNKIMPEEEEAATRMWGLDLVEGPRQALRVLNVLRDRAHTPRLLDCQALEKLHHRSSHYLALCRAARRQGSAASSSSTIPAAAPATTMAPASLNPRDVRRAAPAPAAVSSMDLAAPSPASATYFGAAPPPASPSTAAEGSTQLASRTDSRYDQERSLSSTRAAAGHDIERRVCSSERQQPSAEGHVEELRDHVMTNGDALKEAHNGSSSSPTAVTASQRGQTSTEQPQGETTSHSTLPNGNNIRSSSSHSSSSSSPAPSAAAGNAIEERPSEAGGEGLRDEAMDEPAPTDAQSSATEAQGRGANASNGVRHAQEQLHNGSSVPGDGRGRGSGNGGGSGAGGGGGSGCFSSVPAISFANTLLLEAVQRGEHLGFVSPNGAVSFGRLFDPQPSWEGYETFGETTEDGDKVLPATTHAIDVAASSLVPGGGRLLRVKPLVWVFVPRRESAPAREGSI